MKTSISMLRLIRSASASSSSQSQLLLRRRGYFSESAPEQKGSVLGAAGAVGQTLAGYINTRSEAVANMTSNPISPTVPIAAEIFKKAGTYDERKPFGVTSLDVIRAKTFYGGKAKVPAEVVNVPVFGGHAGITTLPLFSQAGPKANLAEEDFKALTKHSQDEGTEVGDVKTGKGPATFSMVFASALFADACLKGLNGAPGVVEGSFEHCSIIELPKMLIYLWPLPLFWHINNGIEEIIKDYVHHEITRTWILVSFRLFLLIAVKDVFLSFAFPG